MNRRDLIRLAGGALVSGVAATRAYSFLTNNPLTAGEWYESVDGRHVPRMYRSDGHLDGTFLAGKHDDELRALLRRFWERHGQSRSAISSPSPS